MYHKLFEMMFILLKSRALWRRIVVRRGGLWSVIGVHIGVSFGRRCLHYHLITFSFCLSNGAGVFIDFNDNCKRSLKDILIMSFIRDWVKQCNQLFEHSFSWSPSLMISSASLGLFCWHWSFSWRAVMEDEALLSNSLTNVLILNIFHHLVRSSEEVGFFLAYSAC